MAESTAGALSTLAAEIRAELPLIARTVSELAVARPTGVDASSPDERVRLYATAALLDTFYTAIERVLERVARQFGAMPSGPHWHMELVAAAGLELPALRPAVLTAESVAELKRYLGFRHRFRNLYLFDLDAAQMEPLYGETARTWCGVERDLRAFAGELEAMALAVSQS